MRQRQTTVVLGSSTHVAFLRGINVGGKNKLPMKALAELFKEAGCTDVRTYIQSGNVVFRVGSSLVKLVQTSVGEAIERQYGYVVPVVTRTAAALAAALEENPFLKAPGEVDPSHLHVAFLAKKPTAKQVAKLDPERSPSDAFVVSGREVFLHCPNGLARTKLTNAYLDSTLGTTSTVRNWRTVSKLVEMCGEESAE